MNDKAKSKNVAARLDDDVYRSLTLMANKEERTVSWMVNKLLRQALKLKARKPNGTE